MSLLPNMSWLSRLFARPTKEEFEAAEARRRAIHAEEMRVAKEAEEARAKLVRAAAANDDYRRLNYNNPIAFLMGQSLRYVTDAEWAAKKMKWAEEGVFAEMYASTDPSRYGRLGPSYNGSMMGRDYADVEAEVRRLCMTP
jgi:hypothetical protein